MCNKQHYLVVFLFLVMLARIGGAHAQTYNDLTLDQAINIALEKNRDIINAKEDVKKASFQITEAASAAYPSLNGFWDFDRVIEPMVFVIQFPDPDTGKLVKNRLKVGTDHTMGLGAALTQPLYVGGKVGTALKAAKIYRNISENSLETVRQGVVAGVVISFNNVILTKEMLTINRESLAQAERNLENVQSRYEAGTATKYDLLRAKVQVANRQPELLKVDNQLIIAYLNLKEILGISPDVPLNITGTLAEPDTSIFDISSLETALENRPDLKASKSSVDLYDKSIKIAKGNFLPTLTAGSTFMYSGNFDTFKYDAEDWNRNWTASLNLSFPIFSGFRNSSQYKQAKTDYYKAKTNYNKAYDVVVIEVQEGVLNLRNAIKTIESQRMNVEEAEMALGMAESMYKNGKATQLEVFDMQLTLELAKTNMINAIFEAGIAEITLKQSLGLIVINTAKGNES
ncbi:TolC family protein [Candidatus Latescibacterota bacterium]